MLLTVFESPWSTPRVSESTVKDHCMQNKSEIKRDGATLSTGDLVVKLLGMDSRSSRKTSKADGL